MLITLKPYDLTKLDKFFDYLSKEKDYSIEIKFSIYNGNRRLGDIYKLDNDVSPEFADLLIHQPAIYDNIFIDDADTLKKILGEFNRKKEITFLRKAEIYVKEKYKVIIESCMVEATILDWSLANILRELFDEIPWVKICYEKNDGS